LWTTSRSDRFSFPGGWKVHKRGFLLFIASSAFILLFSISFSGELPTIIEINPPDGAIGVPLDTEIVIRFSKPMDPESILGCVIKIEKEGEEGPDMSLGSLLALGFLKLSWNDKGDTLSIKLSFSLSPNSTYKVRIVKNTAKDREGNPLLLPFTESSFSTIDTIPPKFEILYERPVASLGEFPLVVKASEPLSSVPQIEVLDSSSKVIGARFFGMKDGGYEFHVLIEPSTSPGMAKVSVKGVDLSGNVGTDLISGGSFQIDNIASLSVERPVDGAVVGGEMLDIIGKADPEADIQASIDGVLLGKGKADGKGEFALRVKLPADDGEYRVRVESRDPFGNVASPQERRIVVDRRSYLVIRSPEGGFVTSGDSVVVEGVAEPGSEIRVDLDGVHLMDLKASEDGSFGFEVRIGDREGRREISLVAVDRMGNTSPPASVFVVRDISPPSILVKAPGDRSMIPGWKVEVKGVISDLTDSQAWISREGEKEIPLSLSADGSFSAEIQLSPGPNRIRIRAKDIGGRESSYSFEIVAPIPKGFEGRMSMRCLGDDSASISLLPGSVPHDMFLVMERASSLDPGKMERLGVIKRGGGRLYRITAKDMDGKEIKGFKFEKPAFVALKAEEGEFPMMWNGVGWVNAPSVFRMDGLLEISLFWATDIAVVPGIGEGPIISAFPNPFTPGSDGINDFAFFSISSSSTGGYATLRIKSLSGSVVREISFPIPGIWGWNGRDMEGRLVPSGPYIWILELGAYTRSGIILVAR
jgi:hypothetical protein